MKLGLPATGDDFFGRNQELKDLWRYLEGEHILFPGVRRLGKTSILKRLMADAPEHGLLARWLDVSSITTAQQFVDLLEEEFHENAVTHFLSEKAQQVSRWMERIRNVDIGVLGVELDTSAAPEWERAARKLQARPSNQPLLILLDEFPMMLERLIQKDRSEAEGVLAWLRIWRQTGSVCRFVFTGSISLQSLLENHGLATSMNDCYTYPLGPFKPEEARGLWRHVIARESPWQVSDAVIDHALARTGWLSPYFLCLLLDENLRAAQERRQECAADAAGEVRIEKEDVEDAYEKLLAERSRFHHWKIRLRKHLPTSEQSFCLRLLTLLSQQPDGLTLRQLSNRLSKHEPDPDRRAQRLQDLLVRLTDEGYTSPPDAGGRVKFLSFPLRDWWKRNHV